MLDGWKNVIENSILIILIFVGLGVYTNMVLEPILIEAIRTENVKTENNITTQIDNKFKKIESLTNEMPYSAPITSETISVKPSEPVNNTSLPQLPTKEKKKEKRKKFLGIF